jgi:hypothetical protein
LIIIFGNEAQQLKKGGELKERQAKANES